MPVPPPPTGSRAELLSHFQNPPAAYRGKPFWSWNGVLRKEELLRQIGLFEEMGMGGVFMHSRTGLATEYLGDEWFDLINACADEAERRGLESWLYDEDRWPSGSAGGKATIEAKYRMKYLRLAVVAPEGLAWPEREYFVAAFEGAVDGLNLGDYRPLAYGAQPGGRPGESVLLVTWEYMWEGSFYNGNTYLDTLKREATDHFITLTHDRYAAKCGDRVGKSISGIFTDEPHHGLVMCNNHALGDTPQPGWLTPYTEVLFAEYEKRFGERLEPRLPELFLRLEGRRHSPVKWRYMELLQQLFLENWARPLRDWCRAHGMALTGHVLHEDSLAAQAVPCGSVMRYYEYLDIPGIDVLGSRNDKFWIAKQLQSVGRQMGFPWLLSELYGCTGWQTDFTAHKRIGDWQAVLGINLRCHHLSWVTMAGESKRDYPASIFYQSAWYREYAAVETYFSRLHVLLQAGEPVCDVLVLNPIESVWAQVHVDWAKWLESDDPDVDRVEARYAALFRRLTGAQVDFDYGDEDHLARFGSVELGGLFQLGRSRYRTVVVAGMETIRSSTLRLLEAFRAEGGNLVFVGAPPELVDVEPSEQAVALSARSVRVDEKGDGLTMAVAMRSGEPVPRFTTPAATILSQVRRDGKVWIAVFVNTSEEAAYPALALSFKGPGEIQEWDLLTGRRYAVPTRADGALQVWTTSFQPLQERVFVIGWPEAPEAARADFAIAAQESVAGPFAYELDEPNLCVLDAAAYRCDGGAWQGPLEIVKVDEAVRAHWGLAQRAGEMIQPWARKDGAAVPCGRLGLRFEFDVAAVPEGPVELVLEMPERFAIRLNGAPVAVPETTEWTIDPCFRRVPLPSLKPGVNVIELETAFSTAVDLEALYLRGRFGVVAGELRSTIVALPERLAVGDVAAQGLPFYSGRLRYRVPLPPAKAGEARRLEVEPAGAAAVVFYGSKGERLVPWAPFAVDPEEIGADGAVEVELILTRRNTFGPLHLLPKDSSFISPYSFRTQGEVFSAAYQLFPAGLLQAPRLLRGA